MKKEPFKIEFIEPQEIRMGSSYNHCGIKLIGDTKINLENGWWQDTYAWNDNYTKLALVKWNLDNNEPGFHIVIIDVTTGKRQETKRIFGCINSIAFKTDKLLSINKFKYTGQKTASGDLIGHFDEVIEI